MEDKKKSLFTITVLDEIVTRETLYDLFDGVEDVDTLIANLLESGELVEV